MSSRTGLSSLLVIVLFVLASANASAAATVTRTPVGRLTLVREHYVHEGTPIPHGAGQWRKNRLEWLSGDGRVRLFLEDDGAELAPKYGVIDDRLPDGEACFGEGDPQAYQAKIPPERRWRSLRTQFDRLLRYCVWLDEDQRRSYLLEFAGAASDFAAGLDLLKQAAKEDFGGWRRRCVKIRVNPDHGPSPRVKCVRYSAKAN